MLVTIPAMGRELSIFPMTLSGSGPPEGVLNPGHVLWGGASVCIFQSHKVSVSAQLTIKPISWDSVAVTLPWPKNDLLTSPHPGADATGGGHLSAVGSLCVEVGGRVRGCPEGEKQGWGSHGVQGLLPGLSGQV